MGSRKWIESFGGGAGIKQMSPRARIEHSGTSGVLSWSLMILSSQPACWSLVKSWPLQFCESFDCAYPHLHFPHCSLEHKTPHKAGDRNCFLPLV